VALRISRTVFSALSGMPLLACLIVAPQRGYDEPAILSYAISSFCPTSADGLHSINALNRSPVVGSCSQIKQDCAGCCPDCKQNCRRSSNGREPWSRFALGLLLARFAWFEISFDPVQLPIECDRLRS